MYLSKIYTKNFRSIKELFVEFEKKLHMIIGARIYLRNNGSKAAISKKQNSIFYLHIQGVPSIIQVQYIFLFQNPTIQIFH